MTELPVCLVSALG